MPFAHTHVFRDFWKAVRKHRTPTIEFFLVGGKTEDFVPRARQIAIAPAITDAAFSRHIDGFIEYQSCCNEMH